MTQQICILGGTGFIGRHLTRRLAALGHCVTVLTRRRERHRALLVVPSVHLVQGDVYDPEFLGSQFDDVDTVVNLVGILNARDRNGDEFYRAHAQLPDIIAAACQRSGVGRLLHMSALNADPDHGPSHYLRSKGTGEAAVQHAHSEHLRVTSFRPSVVFGADDSFTLRFAELLRAIPALFPLACSDARFQPIHVDDVVTAFVNTLTDRRSYGQRYALCGPTQYSLHEIVQLIAALTQTDRHIIRLTARQSRWQAVLLEFVPGKPFSRDNFDSMAVDSVCDAMPAAELSIVPRSLEEIAPGYLRPRVDTLSEMRRHARR